MDYRQLKKLVEPTVLFLMWKNAKGKRFKVGELYPDRFIYEPHDSADMQKAKNFGFKGFPAFSIDKLEHKNPVEIFMRRCPPKDRSDYGVYLKSFGLNPDHADVKNLTDFALLGYCGAYVPTDPFNLVNPFLRVSSPFDFIMQVAGAHHTYFESHIPQEASSLINQKINVQPEPENEFDPYAVALYLTNGEKLGYVQKNLSKSFLEWNKQGLINTVEVCRTNGRPDHPYVYAYIQIGKF